MPPKAGGSRRLCSIGIQEVGWKILNAGFRLSDGSVRFYTGF